MKKNALLAQSINASASRTDMSLFYAVNHFTDGNVAGRFGNVTFRQSLKPEDITRL